MPVWMDGKMSKRARIVSQFEEDVTSVVKSVLGNAESPLTVNKIVQHLLSDDVGATCMEDLEFITPAMLPPTLGLKPIKAAQLLRYLTAPGACPKDGGAGTHSQAGSRVLQQQSQERVESVPPTWERPSGSRSNNSSGQYSFTVPWSSLPKDTLDKLNNSEVNKERAQQTDIDTLKLAIVKMLVRSYEDYKDVHSGLKKHPGSKVYPSITDQVFSKFRYTLSDVINGKVVGDGKAGFERAILVCTENQMRQKNNNPTAIPNAVRATGIVGVLEDQYMPNLDGTARKDQEKIREDLQIIYNEDSETWLWDDIKEKMIHSYELQRDDIATAKVAIEQAANNQDKENEEGESDEPTPKALCELMNLWPFLFYIPGLTQYHNRLTGRDLQPHLNEFLEKHLEYTLHFLTSCSKSNKKNMALGLKLDKKVQNWTVPLKFLKAIYMIANHFGEDKYIFIHSSERTTPAGEIDTKGLADICIIAQDNDAFTAEKYFVCADEIVLMEVGTSQEAITSLIQLAFVLDLDYPKMPLTFEFMERFVYGMGLSHTRVKNKKGKTLLVLTPSVRNTINELNTFEKEIQEDE